MVNTLIIIDVERFLTKCKIAANSNFWFELTEKNKSTLTALGYIEEDVFLEILKLRPEDFEEGPVPDQDGYDKDWWVFGKIIQGYEIYIKLKVKDRNIEGEKQLTCLCISFHFAEHPLKFPYKKS